MSSPHPSEDRDPIELLAESFVLQLRKGEHPSIEDYIGRYPELGDEIRELLPALVELERNASVGNGSPTSPQLESQADNIPQEFGEYTILRVIGRGGMGIVYEAVQESLGRHVALKVLSSELLTDPLRLDRFRLEARSAAKLHHTNIVPVFGVGEHQGTHYYAMQFIHGQSLDLIWDELRRMRSPAHGLHRDMPKKAPDQYLRTVVLTQRLLSGRFPAGTTVDGTANHEIADPSQRPDEITPATPSARASDGHNSTDGPDPWIMSSVSRLSTDYSQYFRSVARIAEQVANAIAFAHGQGVLHRDIKPSNLILDSRGTVWLTDFGLAKAEGVDGLTRTGDIVGTLRYMAPERFSGWSDPRSDVYSLGVSIYEFLTLRHLHDANSRGHCIEQILHENPIAPRRIDPRIPRDLETIALTAIAKEPASRYASAEAMAEDLRRFLADKTILARRASPPEKVYRWCRRNRIVTALGLSVVALLLTAVGILIVSNLRNQRMLAELRDKEQVARIEANTSRAVIELLQQMLASANPDGAKGADYSVRQLLDDFSLQDQLADQPEVEATLRATMGNAYRRLRLMDKADSHLQRALDIRLKVLPKNHELVGQSLLDLAWNKYEMRRHERAKVLVREALDIFRQSGTTDKTIEGLSVLQLILIGQQRYPDSEKVAEEALALGKSSAPQGSGELANVLHRRAICHLALADPVRAEGFARDAVAAHRRWHGERHPETAWGLFELGRALLAQSKFDQAAEPIRAAMEIFRHQYGDDNDTVLECQSLLYKPMYTEYIEHGRYAEAAELVLHTFLNRQTGEPSSELLENLMVALRKSGDHERSNAICREILQWADAMSGSVPQVELDIARTMASAHLGEWNSATAACERFANADRSRSNIPFGAWAHAISWSNSSAAALDDANREQFLQTFYRVFNQWVGDSQSPSNLFAWARSLVRTSIDDGGEFRNQGAWAIVRSEGVVQEIGQFALAAAEQAAKELPDRGHVLNTVGVAQYRMGKWQDAIDTFEANRKLSGTIYLAEDGYFLAMAYFQQGNTDRAMKWIQAVDKWCTFRGPVALWDVRIFRAEALGTMGMPFTPIVRKLDTSEQRLAFLQLLAQAAPDAQWLSAIRREVTP